MNRRKFVIGTGAVLLSPVLRQAVAIAHPLEGNGDLSSMPCSYSEEMSDMLVSYLVKRLNYLAAEWDQNRNSLNVTADIESRNHFVQAKVIEMLRGFPERNPLEPVRVRVLERDGYRIENVMFQSRPDFWMTGNLYVPAGDGPFPGIISPCGHYPLARMQPTYQSVYLNLVKSGFVVLAYDPIGQGERRQYWNPETNVTDVDGGPVYEHSMCGQLLLLLGENLTAYMVWDGMRAIDYLLSRPEVDPKRIGCAGHSGGGTLTKFISAVDERVKCAAIMEGGTANRWPIEVTRWEPMGTGDVEQNLFPAALYGVDNVDLQIAIAPRPLIVGIEHYAPPFDRAAQSIETRYQQLGVPEKFATVASNDPHSWTLRLRLATTDWFCRWFYDRKGPATEPPFQFERPEDLYCTPNGSVRYSHQGQTIFSLIEEKQSQLPPRSSAPQSAAERNAYFLKIRNQICDLLRYQKLEVPLNACRSVTTPRKGYHIDKLQFISEAGIYIPTWVYVPENRTGKLPAILYVNDEGVESEGMEFEGEEGSGLGRGLLQQLALAGNLVVAVDVRGVGETRPSHSSRSESSNEFAQLFDLETALSYMAWSAGQSLLGMRVQDVGRAVDYVLSRDDVNGDYLHMIGQGMGGIWCIYAAALDSRITSLISEESLLSYRSLTQVDRYRYGADVFVPDLLLHLDLPDVAASLGGRPLVLINPQDAMKRMVDESSAQEAYKWTKATYEAMGRRDNFKIECNGEHLHRPEHYLDLIRSFSATGTQDHVGVSSSQSYRATADHVS